MSYDAAVAFANDATNLDLNEADTRFHLIDRLLREILGWPSKAFTLEKSTVDGYSDYVLTRPNGTAALIIEAKRTGVHFEFPANFNSGKQLREVKIRALLSSSSLRDALMQAQRYATDLGCEHAAVSNGQQMVIFRAFERGRQWKELPAIAISSADWFRDAYTDAVALLGYSSLIERNSLRLHFENRSTGSRELFFPKEKISAFDQIVNANYLAADLRPIVQRYFGALDVEDPEFIGKCYVNERAYDKSLKGIRSLIRDSVSPFMETYGVVDTQDNKKGGAIGKKLSQSIRKKAKGDVVVLFGGKGSGKSTFLRRVLQHAPPQFLKKHSIPVVVDLLNAPKEAVAIRTKIWDDLVRQLDTERVLDADRDTLLKLFEDRWIVACKQDLYGFNADQPIYTERLNALVASWKQDVRYVANRLVQWHRQQHRGVIVALDNTDQLDSNLQDYAFSVAEEIKTAFGCVVLISMREERFYGSKVRGMLDAYQNSAFHISSPSSVEVLQKRIGYVLDLLRSGEYQVTADPRDLIKFLRIFQADLRRDPTSPLNRFVSASAHGNVRLALDLFVELLVSGYTNAREMIDVRDIWTIQIHQVLRPLMTPTRLFYEEKHSRVPNLFQVRLAEEGSHFTGLRILKSLASGQDPTAPSYVPLGELRAHFASTFGNDEDLRLWLDSLLASNLVEASTRQDFFSEEIDSLRITPFGQFALNDLHKIFTYIELVATEGGLREESTCNALVRLSNEEVQLLHEKRRLERVKRRLQKANVFVEYLEREEERERQLFALPAADGFAAGMATALAAEEMVVRASARRNA